MVRLIKCLFLGHQWKASGTVTETVKSWQSNYPYRGKVTYTPHKRERQECTHCGKIRMR